MIFKSTTKDLIYFSILILLIILIQIFASDYLKAISYDLINKLQKDEYTINSMKYVSYLGTDEFRLFLISIILVIGTKFQLILFMLIYSFSSIITNFLKINIREIRPYWQNSSVNAYLCSYDFGFPQDHIVITIPFTFFFFEVIYDRLDLGLLVNAKYFYYIGNSICLLIGLSIGFSRFVLGLNYLDQYIQGVLLGLAIWFFFKYFLNLTEVKFLFEISVIYQRNIKLMFIYCYNLIYFAFLLNFLINLKFFSPELDQISLLRNIEVCNKIIYPNSSYYLALIDSCKYYCLFFLIISDILDNDEKKLEKIRKAFGVTQYNKTIFYDLCLKYYVKVRKDLENHPKKLNDILKNKNEIDYGKGIIIILIFPLFVGIKFCLNWINVFLFNDNIITKFYLVEFLFFGIIGYLALMINTKQKKYFKFINKNFNS